MDVSKAIYYGLQKKKKLLELYKILFVKMQILSVSHYAVLKFDIPKAIYSLERKKNTIFGFAPFYYLESIFLNF